MNQVNTARKKIEKEAKKMRKLYKKKVEKDIQIIENTEVNKLE